MVRSWDAPIHLRRFEPADSSPAHFGLQGLTLLFLFAHETALALNLAVPETVELGRDLLLKKSCVELVGHLWRARGFSLDE